MGWEGVLLRVEAKEAKEPASSWSLRHTQRPMLGKVVSRSNDVEGGGAMGLSMAEGGEEERSEEGEEVEEEAEKVLAEWRKGCFLKFAAEVVCNDVA